MFYSLFYFIFIHVEFLCCYVCQPPRPFLVIILCSTFYSATLPVLEVRFFFHLSYLYSVHLSSATMGTRKEIDGTFVLLHMVVGESL